jgi:membrane fusion protein, multidrug efflux system
MTDVATTLNRDLTASLDQPSTSTKGRTRRRLFVLFAAIMIVAAGGWWVWSTFLAADNVATENAYTNVEVSQVTPLVGGPVARVLVVNSQQVRAGDVLVELDDVDLRLAVEQADATLARARREIRRLFENDVQLAGQERVRTAEKATAQADLVRAQTDLDKARLDERRRVNLADPGAISQQELSDAKTRVQLAEAAVAQATARIAASEAARGAATGARRANRVLYEDASIDTHPEVLAMKARLDQARIDLARAVIRAPIDGVVDQRRVAVGQRVQPGMPLMVIVPVQDIYVDANFKEVQLRRVKPGQPVLLTSDLYGEDVVYHGRVVGFAGGTGSAFAAIPAQNATGNWIKVVQRLPVRVRLDPKELGAHPLRVGLSMHATIDLSGAQ